MDFNAQSLTIEEAKLLQALIKSYARKNLIDFSLYTYKKYKPNWHHFLVADRLEMLARGDIHRLAINMPPRHGKSELVSIRFPAWYLGNNPHKSIIAASYNAKLAEDFGKKARNVVASLEYKDIFPEAKLSEESAARLNWNLEENFYNRQCPKCSDVNWVKRSFGRTVCKTCGLIGEFKGARSIGYYYGAGIGGGITGKGADVLIIDDPIKDRLTARSITMRNNVWDWYSSTAYQRLEESNLICICQTRWHEDDLTARALQNRSENSIPWEVLSIQGIAEETKEYEIFNQDYIDILGTNIITHKRGEPLWTDKYPLQRLLEIKENNPFEFAAQYQQSPRQESGGIFSHEHLRYADMNNQVYTLHDADNKKNVAVSHCTRFITADLASRITDTSDYTVICTWEVTPDSDLILIDCFRKRIEGAEHINLIWELYNKYHPAQIGIESVAYQITLIQTALKQGLPVVELKADKDKLSRALPAAAKMEAHKLYIMRGIPELDQIISELTNFPNGKHDDIVDNFGYAAAYATNMKKVTYFPKNIDNIIPRSYSAYDSIFN